MQPYSRTPLLSVLFLVSTLYITLCYGAVLAEDVDHPWMQPMQNDQGLKDFFEMNRGVDGLFPLWKRAPSSSFYGMRGKKVPSSNNFYGMRGKKGPSGFLGMRGKKEDGNMVKMETRPASLNALLEDLYRAEDERESLEKRAPAQGFMGLRGKRSLGSSR